MKRINREIALFLTLCMVFTCAIPAYAEEVNVPGMTAETFEAPAEIAEVAVGTEAVAAEAAEAVEAELTEGEAGSEMPVGSEEKTEQAAMLGTDGTQPEITYNDYIDGKMVKKTIPNAEVQSYVLVTSNTVSFEPGTWYVVSGTVNITNRIQNKADAGHPAHLILVDGARLTVKGGIQNEEGKSLTIYGQSGGTGALTTENVADYNAGIGGYKDTKDGGTLVVNGGIITTTGGCGSAGIGGAGDELGSYTTGGNGGTITINGGIVNANGGKYSAGIGDGCRGGSTGSSITINGGTINATGGLNGAGIGGGYESAGGTITITGGTINAQGGRYGAGIGAGSMQTNAAVTISGGDITAIGAGACSIGGGLGSTGSDCGTLNFPIKPAEIKAGDNEESAVSVEVENYQNRYVTYEGGKMYHPPVRYEKPYAHLTYAKADYTVKHLLQTGIGSTEYELKDEDTEILNGFINNDTAAVAKQYAGYHEQAIKQRKIQADSSTVVEIKYDLIYYTLQFDANGHGVAPEPTKAVPDASISAPDVSAEGYLLEGWYKDKACTDKFTFSKMPSENLMLYAKWVPDETKRQDIQYVDEDGSTKTAPCIILSKDQNIYQLEEGEWYAVKGDVTIGSRIINTASAGTPAHLILTDASALTVTGGVQNESGKSLSIYGQSEGTGELITSEVPDSFAGIGGGDNESGGVLTVNGGKVTATGGNGGAGIGGGNGGAGGTLTVNSGEVITTGSSGADAIGAGSSEEELSHGNIVIDESVLAIFAGKNWGSLVQMTAEQYKNYLYPYASIHSKAEPVFNYTVEHYKQRADGSGYDEAETENLKGRAGEKTSATIRSYDGFKSLSFEQQAIKEDESTVVCIYYDRLSYMLVFDVNGHGKAPATITARYDANIPKPTDPTADGYIFGGWYEEEACTTPYTFATMPLGGKTIYAKWEKSPEKKYTITWMLNDITLIDTTEVTEGEMPVHSNPAIEGRIFIGWKPALAPVTGNVKYTAYFEERGTNKIAVTFHTDGGTFINTQVIDRNTTPSRPADPQKAGCRFEGWYREPGFITPYHFDEPFNTDMTLYAKWEVLPAVVYTVTWNLDDGTLIDTTEVKEGDMPSHSSPSKEGYIFVGWEPDLSPVTKDITYTAQFVQRSPDMAAVMFNTGGGSFIETQVVTKGQKAQRPADPIKSGYSFVNWYADAAFAALYDFSTAVTADITLFAKWQKNAGREYTITFKDWDGKTLATVKVEEGGLPVYPYANPSRAGYIFTYWDKIITLAVADTTYTATYEPKSSGGGGGGGGSSAPAAKKAAVTFSPNWYTDELGVWRIKNSAGQVVTNAWLCDDAVAANGQNVWYLLRHDGAMIAAGLVQDATGNFYSLETNHDGYFGMLRYTDGYYNCNGQQVYLKFSHEHNGTFGAVVNPDGIEKLKAIYGVTQYGIGNENAVYTKTF